MFFCHGVQLSARLGQLAGGYRKPWYESKSMLVAIIQDILVLTISYIVLVLNANDFDHLASLVNLARAWFDRPSDSRIFVTRVGIWRVLAVLLPFAVYVFAIGIIGIYVASALYVALFMWWFGRYTPVRGLAVGLVIATTLFLMFEVWFLVPLPKGPVEQWLGY